MTEENGTIYLSQGELADIIGVDRSTIHAWQRDGLPYEAQGRGKPGRYIAPVALNWWGGREAVRKQGLNITCPKLTALYGHSLGMGGQPDWEKSAKRLAALMNVTGPEFYRLFGMVQGMKLMSRR